MFDVFLNVIGTFIEFLKIPFFIVLGFVTFYILLIGAFILYRLARGEKFLKRTVRSKYKKHCIFRRLFFDAPLRISKDMINKNPNDFRYKGVVIFTGRQGRGKTIAMAKSIIDMQDQYPLAKTITNFAYTYEDKQLDHWKRLIDFKNGKQGVIAAIDETQNWFSCNQSKNFPPEMLSVITQNRKNTRIILGTAQNFYLLAKALRSQCTEVRECMTILGCITFVRRREPILDCNGEVQKYKHLGFYFFVHDDKLRNCYDTYKCIENLKHSGFQEKTVNVTDINVSVN